MHQMLFLQMYFAIQGNKSINLKTKSASPHSNKQLFWQNKPMVYSIATAVTHNIHNASPLTLLLNTIGMCLLSIFNSCTSIYLEVSELVY